MSIASLNSSTSLTTSSHAARAEHAEASGSGVVATLASIASATAEGVSATVSFSGKALHALEHAGEMAVDGIEYLAVGAWHALESAEHAGEVVADAVSDGVHEVVATARSVGKELAHYAEVGFSATGEAASEVASGTVLAAAAVGKTIAALV
jgi:hypothetical protein